MENGLITIQSSYSVEETMARLVNELEKNGMYIFLRIDHKLNATKIGIDIRATEMVIFGKPQTVSYTHLRAHETVLDLVCRLLLEKKKDYYIVPQVTFIIMYRN